MSGWAKKFRGQMAEKLDGMYRDLPCSEFSNVRLDLYDGNASTREAAASVLDLSLDGMKSHLTSYKFLGEEMLVFLSRLLDVNLIILDRSTQSVYRMALSPDLYDQKREGAILVLYRPGTRVSDPHFECAGIMLGEKVVTYFENGHSAIKSFRDELGW